MNERPKIGDIVHYVSYGTPPRADGSQVYASKCRAAVVTEVIGRATDPATFEEVDLWVVGLCVLNPTGQFFNTSVVQMENAHDGGTWHYRRGSCG